MIFSTITFPISGLSIATSAIVARYIGQNDNRLAGQGASYGIAFAVVLGCLLTFLMFAIGEDILLALNTEPEVAVLAESYLNTVMSFCVVYCVGSVVRGILKASGDTVPLMSSSIVGTVVNTICSWLLIYGIGPFPELKVVGASIGTGIGQTTTTVCLIYKLIKNNDLTLRIPSLKKHILKKVPTSLLRIAIPGFCELLFLRGGHWGFFWIVTGLGTIPLSAHYIGIRVEGFAYFPAAGLSLALTPIVGQCLGAGKNSMIKKAVRETAFLSIVLMAILGLVFLLIPMPFVQLFSPTKSVYNLAVLCVQISALELPVMALAMVYLQVLKAAGDTFTPMVITLLGSIVTRIGIVYCLAVYLGFGLAGVWFGTAIDWGLRAFAAYVFYRREKWMDVKL